MDRRTLLHVGCGPKRLADTVPGFNDGTWREIRLDIDVSVGPDIVGSMVDLSGVRDASVDAIFSSHSIEHLYPHEVPVALGEFLRVLSADGFCVITCPDLKAVCQRVAEDRLLEPLYVSAAGPIAPLDILYGHRPSIARGRLYMAHRCGFTETTLRQALRASGFPAVATTHRPGSFELCAIACKGQKVESDLRALAETFFVR